MSQMSAPTMKRPGGVMVIAALLFIAALFNLWLGILAILSTFGDNPTITDWQGTEHSIPGSVLIINGILWLLMGLIYFWIMRLTLVGSASAQLILTFFVVINIVFALFRLPEGFLAIALNLIVLLLIYTKSAKEWFSQNP